MRVDPRNHIGGAIYWRGFHSRRILRCLDRLLQPHMTLFDVGANQGEVTLYAARRLSQGRVVAFEPVDDHYRRLANNLQLNGLTNVVACNYCLGDRNGEVQLFATSKESSKHRHGWNEGLASMFADGSQAEPFSTAKVCRLDDVVSDLKINRLDVLKIDVEGGELNVLRGARQSIVRFRPSIIVEMNAETFRSAGYASGDLCSLLQDLKYDGFQINRSGRVGKSRSRQLPDLCDMLWVPRRACAAAG
jgi:FkbM family methyltransferase